MSHATFEIGQFLQPVSSNGATTGALVRKIHRVIDAREMMNPGATYLASRDSSGSHTLIECLPYELPGAFRPGSAYLFDRNHFGINDNVVVEATPHEAREFARRSLGIILKIAEHPGRIRVDYENMSRPNFESYVGWINPIIYATDRPFGVYAPRQDPHLGTEPRYDIALKLQRMVLDGNGLTVGTTYDKNLKPTYPTAFSKSHQVVVVKPTESPTSGGVGKLVFVPPSNGKKFELISIIHRMSR